MLIKVTLKCIEGAKSTKIVKRLKNCILYYSKKESYASRVSNFRLLDTHWHLLWRRNPRFSPAEIISAFPFILISCIFPAMFHNFLHIYVHIHCYIYFYIVYWEKQLTVFNDSHVYLADMRSICLFTIRTQNVYIYICVCKYNIFFLRSPLCNSFSNAICFAFFLCKSHFSFPFLAWSP